MRPNGIIIAIDGPAGVGKSTVGKMVADRVGYSFISTGKMYRALAWKALELGLDLEDDGALVKLAGSLKWGFPKGKGPEAGVSLDGRALDLEITDERAGKASSGIARLAGVRLFMRDMQRQAGVPGGVVMEGRDIGTNVFPDAELKVYLDASPEARAERRVGQLRGQGLEADYAQILDFIIKRDAQDSGRKNNPLRKAEDAHYLDSTAMPRENVVAAIERLFREAVKP
ncbi:MAG TPA: (d)CMP kinase [Elusimicrobia bacterium]|nr:MAG: cytidylate kinase [Elusimicrobia bacterium GWF2_62_30]HBA61147.1 (d)CMP kinase [Elusimicrobiota bacterium]